MKLSSRGIPHIRQARFPALKAKKKSRAAFNRAGKFCDPVNKMMSLPPPLRSLLYTPLTSRKKIVRACMRAPVNACVASGTVPARALSLWRAGSARRRPDNLTLAA